MLITRNLLAHYRDSEIHNEIGGRMDFPTLSCRTSPTRSRSASRPCCGRLRLGRDHCRWVRHANHGLTGTNRDRPGLRLALAACRAGDTLVVTKLDRLAWSLPDARDILDELTKRNVKLSLGGSTTTPTGPAAVQRPRDGRRVRIRPDPKADPGKG
jgi:hypothetical protein